MKEPLIDKFINQIYALVDKLMEYKIIIIIFAAIGTFIYFDKSSSKITLMCKNPNEYRPSFNILIDKDYSSADFYNLVSFKKNNGQGMVSQKKYIERLLKIKPNYIYDYEDYGNSIILSKPIIIPEELKKDYPHNRLHLSKHTLLLSKHIEGKGFKTIATCYTYKMAVGASAKEHF